MSKNGKKLLALKKETVKALSETEMAGVNGGTEVYLSLVRGSSIPPLSSAGQSNLAYYNFYVFKF